jgi:hypothetical protein
MEIILELPITGISKGCAETLGKHRDKGTDGGDVRPEVRMIRLIPCVPTRFLSRVAGTPRNTQGESQRWYVDVVHYFYFLLCILDLVKVKLY